MNQRVIVLKFCVSINKLLVTECKICQHSEINNLRSACFEKYKIFNLKYENKSITREG